MRGLIAVVVAFALVWGGYWFVGAWAVERGAEAFFAQAATDGREATRDSLSVAGFPNRFDLTVNGLHLADPARGIGWDAPFVQLLTLSYTPWHFIAAFPNTQRVTTPLGTIDLTSTKLQASLVLKPLPSVPLNRFVLSGEALSATSSAGWTVSAAAARFASRVSADNPATQEIGVEVTNLVPDPALIAVATSAADLPGLVDLLRLDALVTLSAPIDRHAGEAPLALVAVDVKEGNLRWGPVGLFAKGRVDVSADGLPEGRIDLRIENWRRLLPIAVATGAVKAEVAPTIERALTMLATASGNAEVLDLPLVFASGRMSLGPVPLGPAPRLN